ncbi:DNA-binding SAP [Fusarium tjaetaba]|uniref:DNA-binding SAP n=1 Tax=Fusarium tjaetaba TaxID=1567544 RepID=A0A8H5VNN8_9HYPO|nr:DNA-binding SAP [Fusarium tjaetaba]KAF5631652.1 DNA-binding SAP [Fusarium tjaetaba]
MAEYSSLKVPELKKLLAEKGLPQTGNKADLIARLQENDRASETAEKPAENKEDEISYSDDEAPAAPAAAAPVAASEPVAEVPATEAAPVEAAKAEEMTAEKPAETAEPEKSYAIGLQSTAADDEAKKRAERAKRFGIEEDEDAKKRADRAKRFGLDEKELATTLDSALPERSRKRGRDRTTEGEGNRPGKRQSMDRRNGGGGRRRGRGGRDGGRDGGARKEKTSTRSGILDDPTEKAKAEKRAARFAGN